MIDPATILDIGANVGDWARAAHQLWPSASLHLIEANPGCANHLERQPFPFTIALLGATVSPAVDFYTLDDTATGASVYREIGTSLYDACEPVSLPQTTLDDLFPMRTFDLVKLDTQGSELDILRGGQNLITSARWLLLEVSLKPYNQGAPLYPEICRYLSGIGFQHRQTVAENPAIAQRDVLFGREDFAHPLG